MCDRNKGLCTCRRMCRLTVSDSTGFLHQIRKSQRVISQPSHGPMAWAQWSVVCLATRQPIQVSFWCRSLIRITAQRARMVGCQSKSQGTRYRLGLIVYDIVVVKIFDRYRNIALTIRALNSWLPGLYLGPHWRAYSTSSYPLAGGTAPSSRTPLPHIPSLVGPPPPQEPHSWLSPLSPRASPCPCNVDLVPMPLTMIVLWWKGLWRKGYCFLVVT